MTARILEFKPPPHSPDDGGENRFEASVDEDGCIRFAIRNARGQQTWVLTPRQAVELAAFLNNDWMARMR